MELHEISILNLMPPNLAEDRNIKMITEAFDEVLREILNKIPGIAVIPDLVLNQIVNETLIDLLAWQFHVDFYEPDLPIKTKRELVLKSLDWHYRKGTPSVVEEIVSTVFSRAKTQEWYEYGGMPYGFRVATEEDILDENVKKKFIRAINSVKNTRSYFEMLTHLLDYIDEVIMEDSAEIVGRLKFSDTFNYGVLKFNGRVKHDGLTVNPYEYEGVKADGKYKFDGTIKHSPVLVPGRSEIIFPLKARSGISDKFEITIGTGNYDDIFTSRLKHDGRIKADGSHKFNGETVPGDSAIEMSANLSFDDKVSVTDYFPMTVHETIVDHFSTHYKFDGTFTHDGAIKAGAARDEFTSKIKIGAMTDSVQITDGFFVGMRKFVTHDGRYKADGKIKFNSGIRVPV